MTWIAFCCAGVVLTAAWALWFTGIYLGWWVFRPVHSVHQRLKRRKNAS